MSNLLILLLILYLLWELMSRTVMDRRNRKANKEMAERMVNLSQMTPRPWKNRNISSVT